MPIKYQCAFCGHEQGFWNARRMYTCKAPRCPDSRVWCEDCLKKFGVDVPAIFGTVNCPVCKLGEMKNLGTG